MNKQFLLLMFFSLIFNPTKAWVIANFSEKPIEIKGGAYRASGQDFSILPNQIKYLPPNVSKIEIFGNKYEEVRSPYNSYDLAIATKENKVIIVRAKDDLKWLNDDHKKMVEAAREEIKKVTEKIMEKVKTDLENGPLKTYVDKVIKELGIT